MSMDLQATVPTLLASYENGESVTITQSLNILEFLEDSYPGTKRLIPSVTDGCHEPKSKTLPTWWQVSFSH